ncbi:hypothetical protein GX408_20585 [bacterium]|nr:hypothetical protein [bacterium]
MRYICQLGITLWAGNLLFGQGISVKTVPLLSTDQFSLVPSFRDGMAGVSLAVPDGLADLFINPGKMDTAKSSEWFMQPKYSHWTFAHETTVRSHNRGFYYSLEKTNAHSSLLTLPIGVYLQRNKLYSGLMTAVQSLSASGERSAQFKAGNYPLCWLAGLRLPSIKSSIGIGLDYVGIRGIDGVYLLYPNAIGLDQRGSARQFKVGASMDIGQGDRWNVLAGRYFFNMVQKAVAVTNKDENNGWLVQTEYVKKISTPLTLALMVTMDRRHHPKIPDYPLAGVPRDPGNTQAWNFGLGAKWENETSLFGVDLLYEPIDAKTWVDAANDTRIWNGETIAKGVVILRNDYQFYNRILRTGFQLKPAPFLTMASGVQLKWYSYNYYQNDLINGMETTGKPQREWTETVWSARVGFKTKKIDVGYSLQLQAGMGLLERQWLWRMLVLEESAMDIARADFFIPPTIPLNVTPVLYYTQRIILRYTF